MSAQPQALKRSVKGILADGIEDRIHALPLRQVAHALREVLLPVENHIFATGLQSYGGLLFAARSSNDVPSQMCGPPTQEPSDSPAAACTK